MDTNNYNYYEEEDEISLLNLIGYVFRHLKKMLIVSIVVALVLGGLLGYKKSSVIKDDNELDTYLVSKEILDKKIDFVTKDLNKYIEDSSFLDLDAENSYQAKALYYVDTGYQVMPDSTYQNPDYTSAVIDAYVNKLTSNDILKEIAKKHGITENYIVDYVNITSHDYMIDISVYFDNEKDALTILHELEDVMLSFKNEISSIIVENELTQVSESVYQGVNNNIIEVQQEKLETINTYLDNLKELQVELEQLENSHKENGSFIKSFVKFGIVGFVGIFFVMCVYYALAFIFSDKVYSSDEFKDKAKIRVLGNLTFDNANSKYISWINKLEKRPVSNDYDLLVSNIKAYCNTNKVLLSGNLEDSIKEDIVSNLKKLLKNVEIISCGSLLTDSNAVNKLDNVDSVILLAKCNKSSYKAIKEEKNKLNDLNVTNVYAIVVE